MSAPIVERSRAALEPGESVLAEASGVARSGARPPVGLLIGSAVLVLASAWLVSRLLGWKSTSWTHVGAIAWGLLIAFWLRPTRRRASVVLTERRVIVAVDQDPDLWIAARAEAAVEGLGRSPTLRLALPRPRVVALEPGAQAEALVAVMAPRSSST